MHFAHRLVEKGHHITMDNYFTSILLFTKLALWHIYAIGTVQLHHIGLPFALKNLCAFRRLPQAHLE